MVYLRLVWRAGSASLGFLLLLFLLAVRRKYVAVVVHLEPFSTLCLCLAAISDIQSTGMLQPFVGST